MRRVIWTKLALNPPMNKLDQDVSRLVADRFSTNPLLTVLEDVFIPIPHIKNVLLDSLWRKL